MDSFFFQANSVPSYMDKFLHLIPTVIEPHWKQRDADFTRNRELPFPKLVTLILSLTASGKNKGVDTKAGEFFKNARRSGLWPDAHAIHRSSLTKAREKIPWEFFQDLLHKAVGIAYELWPQGSQDTWHGMSVCATDGSKYDLPATEEIRQEFDPQSGLNHVGKGHYPQCLVSTLYDVFRHLPIARTVRALSASEREEAKSLLPYVPPGSVWLFDRGYPSFELILFLIEHFCGYFIFRASASGTFPAVEAFVKSNKTEDEIWITPSNNFKGKVNCKERKHLKPIRLRVIRLVNADGTVSVLLTNLFNKDKFPAPEIIGLYFRRWEAESYFRDEKVVLEIEKFHGVTPNSIRQELFAVMIMSVIARTLMNITADTPGYGGQQEFQFKNAIMALASEAMLLVPEDPLRAIEIFEELICEIARVKYYRKRGFRPSEPRINKKPINKWCNAKLKKLTQNA